METKYEKEFWELFPEFGFLSGIVALMKANKDSGRLSACRDCENDICRDSIHWTPAELRELMADPKIRYIEFEARDGTRLAISRAHDDGGKVGAWGSYLTW